MIFHDLSELSGWIRTTWLPYLKTIPKILQDEFIDELCDRYFETQPDNGTGKIIVKMVRLEVDLIKRRWTVQIKLKVASAAAILEIVGGFFLITVVLFFLGLIISIPAIILEVLLLLKVSQLAGLEEEQSVNGWGTWSYSL